MSNNTNTRNMYKKIRPQYLRETVNINFYNLIYFLYTNIKLVLLCERSEDGQHRRPKHVTDSVGYTVINFVNTVSLRINAVLGPRSWMSYTSGSDMRQTPTIPPVYTVAILASAPINSTAYWVTEILPGVKSGRSVNHHLPPSNTEGQ
jgi:hypothetical protein